MGIERNIAGMHCGEVLADLSNYLDGDLTLDKRNQILAHLEGCDVCERFGGVFTMAIQSLRAREPKHSLEDALAFEHLKVRLDEVTHRDQP